jgi:hypothetical protein
MNASVLVEALSRRGISLALVAGRLEVRPASSLTHRDRAGIRAHLPDIVAALTPPVVPTRPSEPIPRSPAGEPWDQREALRLMSDADALAKRLGVDGNPPTVADDSPAGPRASDRRRCGTPAD